MSLDTPTLFIVATCTTGLLGIFLLLLWVQERGVRALAWWGSAYLIGSSGVALWGAQLSIPFAATALPNALLFIACGLIWNGARLFHNRGILPGALFAGAILWIAASFNTQFAAWGDGRVILSSLIIATYTFLTAYELQSDRRQPRSATVLAPALHGAIFLSPIMIVLVFPQATNADAWFALFALQTLLYVVATAFLVAVMAKEQVALVHKTAAMTDALTGLFNRRAFFEAAEGLNVQLGRKGGSISILVFDLDHFKSVNDKFGHAIGDEVLKLFAITAVRNMRANDMIGRLGGEEFAAVLPATAAEAAIVGERVRLAFQAAGAEHSGHMLALTASVGVAAARAPADVEYLMDRADAALYRAKSGGRNRVTIAAADGNVDFPSDAQGRRVAALQAR
jgi:diguanylate cyclase (GGDEF)-like protein